MGQTIGEDAPGVAGQEEGSRLGDMLHGAARGAVGAMAMTGCGYARPSLGYRTDSTASRRPPARAACGRCCGGRRASSDKGWSRPRTGPSAPAGARPSGALPGTIRRRTWARPAYGLVVWLGFELAIAPVLGLSQAKRVRLVDRWALAADHLLYGLVLSGTRRGTRD